MAESWTAHIRCPSSTFRGQYNVAVTDLHVLKPPHQELGWPESCEARGDAGSESMRIVTWSNFGCLLN